MWKPTGSVESEQKVVKRTTAPDTARTKSPIRKRNDISSKDTRPMKKQCKSAVTYPAGSKKARALRDIQNPVTNRESMNDGDDKIDSPTTSDGSYHDSNEKKPVPSPVTLGHARGKKNVTAPNLALSTPYPKNFLAL